MLSTISVFSEKKHEMKGKWIFWGIFPQPYSAQEGLVWRSNVKSIGCIVASATISPQSIESSGTLVVEMGDA